MALASDVITSTTAEVPGWEVVTHRGVVTAHVVAGANLFSDVAASFSDIFGGRSKSYQKQLSSVNEEALSRLQQKAADRGANCVVGVHIDHDEISGQGKSMFMVKASGTAVVARQLEGPGSAEATNGSISGSEMEVLRRKQRIMRKEEIDLRHGSDIEFATRHRIAEFAPRMNRLLRVYFQNRRQHGPDHRKKIEQRARRYYLSLEPQDSTPALYELADADYRDLWKLVRDVIKEGGFVDLERTKELLGSELVRNRQRALTLLLQEKRRYDADDVRTLSALRGQIKQSFPVAEVRKLTESTVFGDKTSKVWDCRHCGNEVPARKERCERCRRDQRGLLEFEAEPKQALAAIRERIEALQKAQPQNS